MDGFHHQLNRRIDNLPRLLRIKILDEVHGVFDVGEQGGNGLPFTRERTARFHSRLCGENAVGEMTWRIIDRGLVAKG
jgi:hypothetical protein